MIRTALVCLLLATAACNAGEEGSPQREPPPPAPRRIVSLVPSATLTLQALGAAELLVGRTDYDSAASLAHLPSVGGGIHPNLEALVALEPDLVIRFDGESDPSTVARLDDLGIPHLALRPDGIPHVRESIRILGEVVHHQEEGDSILAHLDETLDRIRRRVDGMPPVRVAYLLGGNPPWAAGPETFIGELLEVAGGVNVFADLGGLYGPVSQEEILAREIDLIIAPRGSELSLPTWEIPVRRVPTELEIPGPNLPESALELARTLRPEAFR